MRSNHVETESLRQVRKNTKEAKSDPLPAPSLQFFKSPTTRISIFCQTHKCGLAPEKTDAFTIIQRQFGPFCFQLTIPLKKMFEKCMEKLWEGKDVKAKIIFIKYEKKIQF